MRNTVPSQFDTSDIYQQMIDDSPAGMVLVDAQKPDFPLMYVNSAFERMTGYMREEVIGVNCSFLQGEDREQDGRFIIREAIKKKQSCVVILRNYRKDGRLFWNEVRISPIFNHEGTVTHFIGSQNDITQRIQTEDSLRESEERYRLVVNAMAEGVILQTHDGIIQTFNPAAEQILGLSEEQMKGQDSIDLSKRAIHEDGSPFPTETHPSMLALNTGEPQSNIMMGLHKLDDSLVWILINSQPLVHSHSEKPYAVLTTFVDVTQPRQARQHERAMAMEKERARILTQFIQNSSHEFRTPLSIISMSAYLSQKSNDTEFREQKTQMIETQVQRITRLIDTLLKFTKLQENLKMDQMVRFQDVLQSAFDNIRQLYSNKLNLLIDLQPNLPSIVGDYTYLEDAFKEILDNACRFTPTDGTVNLTATVENQHVVVKIQDNGVGIANDDLEHIFQIFWRQDTAHTTPGFGLGLPIARKIIETYGGTIDAESTVGRGTCMRVALPFMLEE